MKPIALVPGLLLLLGLSFACGGSGSNDGSPGGSAVPTCFDASGKPTSACAVTPSANVCSRGDANSCMTLQTVGVYAATASTGVCLHLVFVNTCQVETYSDTCIETTEDSQGWQCWTSSVEPGSTIDESECDASGKYFFVSTESSGLLDSLEQQCSAPLS